MLYNVRAAFTAALAFLAVPSIANPDASQIIASLNGLSSQLTNLKTTCSSDGSQDGKGEYFGGGGGGGGGFSFGVRDTSNISAEQSLTSSQAISGGFNNIIYTTQTTYTLIQQVQQQQITYSQEEAAEIYKAWTDVSSSPTNQWDVQITSSQGLEHPAGSPQHAQEQPGHLLPDRWHPPRFSPADPGPL